MTLEYPPPAVLARYGPAAVGGLRWVPLRSGGGFSGAGLWRGDDPDGRPALALKAWPPAVPAERLAGIHRLMARAAHLPFVPHVVPARDGTTAVVEHGRVWDLTRWMPGAADFHANPTPARLANACAALAAVHRAWAPPAPTLAPCPGVRRRLALLADAQSGRRPEPVGWEATRPAHAGGLTFDTARLDSLLARLAPAAECELRPWENRTVPVQPCLCDVWHDHLLFTGDAVTGVIDFGAVKTDHVAVDLARLLGSFVPDDDERFGAGLAAYRAAGGILDTPDEFVRTLDRTGAVCAAAFWLRQLAAGPVPNPAAVARRVGELVRRLGRMRG